MSGFSIGPLLGPDRAPSMWARIKQWWAGEPKFKPCVLYNELMQITEIVLEDTLIVWVPWGPYEGHAIDCGYAPDGRLVAMKIWDDVRRRPRH